MNSPRIALVCLIVWLLLSGFTCGKYSLESRPIAAVSGVAHSERPDYKTVEALFTGVGELLYAKGFSGGRSPQPAGQLLGWREYSNHFALAPGILCSVRFVRKSVTIDFVEVESSPHAGLFPATDDQRALVRALAGEIESYLRARLPVSYKIRVFFDKHSGQPDAGD